MTRNEVRTQHVANFLAGATGLAFVWLKYFAKSPDLYSAAGNPWEPAAHSLHVLLSPLLIFAVGLIWRDHVLRKLRHRRKRKRLSGLLIFVLFAPLSLSAYLIQVTVDETWRQAWVIAHLATGALWIVGYVVHIVTKPKELP